MDVLAALIDGVRSGGAAVHGYPPAFLPVARSEKKAC